MDNLQKQIDNLKTLLESYDAVAQAAEAYNVGKTELAANITAKGVPASASETLPELAEKVSAIAQESYTIDGGEMYAKQLFGSLETPNYWNLYEVLSQLLSDGRLVNYGGILLAEYYKGYDSLALSGAGAGGAYVVSDMENGQFKMYTNDTTHTWNDDLNGKGNRWVAYCFADEYHNFDMADTNTSPRSIFIGRKVGTITALTNVRVSQVVVPDGNELYKLRLPSTSYSWQFEKKFVLKNVSLLDELLIYSFGQTESVYVECGTIGGNGLNGVFYPSSGTVTGITFIIKANTISGMVLATYLPKSYIVLEAQSISGQITRLNDPKTAGSIMEISVESGSFSMSNRDFKMITFGYISNDRTQNVLVSEQGTSGRTYTATIVALQEGYCKSINLASYTGMTEQNIVTYILNRLGDNTDQSPLTITLGATNLAKLTAEEIAIATNKGFTLA